MRRRFDRGTDRWKWRDKGGSRIWRVIGGRTGVVRPFDWDGRLSAPLIKGGEVVIAAGSCSYGGSRRLSLAGAPRSWRDYLDRGDEHGVGLIERLGKEKGVVFTLLFLDEKKQKE